MKFPGISKVGNGIIGKHKAYNYQISTLNPGFPDDSVVRMSPYANAGDVGSIPGSGRSPEEGNDKSLQYSYLENPIDRGAWWATVHGVTKSQTGVSN